MVRKISNFFAMAGLALTMSCDSKPDAVATTSLPANVHKVVTAEVLQASAYTYLRVKENDKEEWLAVPSMVAKPGETYYYSGGLEMTNFNSKDLNRTFASVLFLQKVSTDPNSTAADDKQSTTTSGDNGMPNAMGNNTIDTSNPAQTGENYKRSVAPPEKQTVKVEPVKGGVTIKELFEKKKSYEGKTVKVRGKVTKYTPAVMNKNWIHIQDGTDAGGKFDLAITSNDEVAVGDNIVVEGKISLDKDLGYGYFFEVIMEDAKVQK